MLQSSDEDALSNISSSSGKFGAASRKSSVDFVTKFTMFLGGLLMANSFLLVTISTRKFQKERDTIRNYLGTKSQEESNGEVSSTDSSKTSSDKETKNKVDSLDDSNGTKATREGVKNNVEKANENVKPSVKPSVKPDNNNIKSNENRTSDKMSENKDMVNN